METYSNNVSDYGFGDIKNSLLSLQFLDEISQPEPQHQGYKMNQSHTVKNDYDLIQAKQNSCQLNYGGKWSQKEEYNICETKSVQLNRVQQQIEPRRLFQPPSQRCCFSQLQNVVIADQSQGYIPHSLDHIEQSKISNNLSKRQSYEIQCDNNEATVHQNQLNMLKQLQKEAKEINESQDAQQIKQNFQALFQKVYGIIEQIQQRNEKPDLAKSVVRADLRSSARKELAISTRVIELSVGKQNQKLKKKKFCNLQTEFDYDNQSCDQGTSAFNPQLKTQENWCPKTPFPATARSKPASLLSLSKQYPTLVSPKANLNSARSDKSSKSKGLTLVSAEKKLKEVESKKPVKITLMQKRIIGCPQKKVDLNQIEGKTKTDKKSSSFNPTNFFSSRRVSTNRII